ncbi:DUF333 domain-containing protein [Vibrio sp. SCSIO 43136]|uniref:DUF333 domain-containing protein n=1 Tax=Vibrio sp. SCSIO 43136 TaxID=2819101 RepID=UPI002075D674|nr:DUF333 domain-containing protein [Vibrio sp. SCSIO 43136]USD66777.1 DUF333 domain-containing protein [Vibrio sp. SCSIO 43136]
MKTTILAASISLVTLFSAATQAQDVALMPSMANPAAEFCLSQGGELKDIETKDGQDALCVLNDGTEIEQWEYFRSQTADADVMPGMANPASVFCEEQGGQVELDGDKGICVFENGDRVEEWEFYQQHAEQESMPSMANPAAVFCEEQGGVSNLDGTCTLENGDKVDEWEFFRQAEQPLNMTNPASSFCEEQGGEVTIKETSEGQVGFCVTKDGKEIEEWEYYRQNN